LVKQLSLWIPSIPFAEVLFGDFWLALFGHKINRPRRFTGGSSCHPCGVLGGSTYKSGKADNRPCIVGQWPFYILVEAAKLLARQRRRLALGWIKTAGIGREKKKPLFRSVGKGERVSEKAMSRFDVFHMINRRANAAALPYSTCCHTFRATGITTYLENGRTLEHAQTIANHESPRTTKLYDRTREELSAEEIGRIRI
jgi:Phage integrase family